MINELIETYFGIFVPQASTLSYRFMVSFDEMWLIISGSETLFPVSHFPPIQVLTELGQVSDARVIDAKISELQEELNTVWDTLMGYELQLAEQLEVSLTSRGATSFNFTSRHFTSRYGKS